MKLQPLFTLALGLSATFATAADPKVAALTATIDKHLAADWAARGITPAAVAGDAEFCRRVYLDLIGRIPKAAEVRAFEADPAADKRASLVERLLTKPSHATHFAGVARSRWLPETLTDQQTIFLGQQFEDWLRKQYGRNARMDEIVRTVLTTEVFVGQRGQFQVRQPNRPYNADQVAIQSFYQAAQGKPENLGGTVTRAFLGVKLECAQCHDHPFAPYTRDQFWQFAAFFGEFTPLPPSRPSFVGPTRPQADKNTLTIPDTERQVTARFMDGTAPKWTDAKTPREELAEWVTAPTNPYFARNLANRLWAQLFGVGIMDPVDEPGENNPPSHPELLDALARRYAECGFDQRVMIRAIVASKAYNLTSRISHPTQGDPRRFARMNVKSLTGHQIFDSFATATGVRENQPRNQAYYNPDPVSRFSFKSLFPDPPKPTETQTSILQALALMNGKLTADQTSLDKSEILAAVIDAPFLDTDARLETLFLTALSRKPTPDEREKLASYVERGGPSGDKQKALADVFWVLLNSPEFLFNH